MDDADLIIYLVDPDDALLPEDIDRERTLVVYSKRDKRRMADDLSISSVTGEGVSELIRTVELVKNSLNPHLSIQGIVLVMYDGRTNLSVQVVEEVKRFFKDKVYTSIIPRNVRLAEAPSYGLPVALYDPRSRGTEAYMDLADEFLEMEALS